MRIGTAAPAGKMSMTSFPDRKLAGIIGKAFDRISRGASKCFERIPVEGLSCHDLVATVSDRLPRRDSLENGTQRGDQQPGPLGWLAPDPQRVHPHSHAVPGRRNTVVGQAIPRRQQKHIKGRKKRSDRMGDAVGCKFRSMSPPDSEMMPPPHSEN